MRKHRLLIILAAAVAIPLVALEGDAQSWRTMTSSRQVQDQEPMDVSVRYGAGTLEIAPAESPFLYRAEFRYDGESFEPVVEFDQEDRRLRFGIEGRGRPRSTESGSAAKLHLTREVPMDLDLEFGAGKAEIDLTGMALERLELSTGASQTSVNFGAPNPVQASEITIEAGAAELTVTGLGNTRAERITFRGGLGETVLDFGGEWTRSVQAKVEMGIGSLTLSIPREVGVRLARRSFLASFDSAGLERRNDGYYSTTWNDATTRLDMDVSAAIGSIEIVWID